MSFRLPRAVYEREDLEAAALRLGEDAAASLSATKTHFVVSVEPASAGGRFLDAALNHMHRRRVIAFHSALTSAVLSRLLSERFPAPRPDPLEQLEPQVAEDRRRETEALLESARALEGSR